MERKKFVLGTALTVMSLSAAPAGAQVPVDVAALLPTASSCQVSVLDSDSVRVTGAVDPNALATSYRIEYGLLGILNLSTPTVSVGSLPDPTDISAQLDELVPAASYSCRIVALNSAGEVAGSTTTFVLGGSGAGGSDGSGGSNGSNGAGGSGATGATPAVNPTTGQVVAPGTPGAVKCTLSGTAGKDRLKGTKGADVICGLGGADRISGLAGNDTLIGGTGKDRIRGNRGKDRLLGGKGNDKLKGGRGADHLVGWRGRDRMAGNRGSDRFVANRDRRGGDRVNGGRNRDRATVNRGDRMRSIERHRITRV
jgi:Ca2+-binding RTX toxin-like protein